MTVRQLLRSLDSAELTEWMAFLQIEQSAGAKPQPKEVDEDEVWMRAFNCG